MTITLMKDILIVDDDIGSSLKYKKWLEDEGIFNLTLINDPLLIEAHLLLNNTYDLILIGLKNSVIDGINIYDKINKIISTRKVEHLSVSTKVGCKVCFMTSLMINFNALSELYPDVGIECYIPKEVSKQLFLKHIFSVLS